MIRKLKLLNFGRHEDLTVEFRPGVNLIIGANGSGKSTLSSALCYAFTGETLTEGAKTDNLRCGAKKGGVALSFAHKGHDYQIQRGLVGLKNHLHAGSKEITAVKEIDQELQGILQTNRAVIVDNVFARQGAIDRALDHTSTERLKDLQQVFGLSGAEQAYKLLGTELSQYRVTPGLEGILEETTRQLVQAQQDLEEVTRTTEELEQKLTALEGPARQVVEQAEQARMARVALEQAQQAFQRAEQAALQARERFQEAAGKQIALQDQLGYVPSESALRAARQDRDDLQAAWNAQSTWQSRQERLQELQRELQALPPAPTEEAIAELRQAAQQAYQKWQDLVALLEGRSDPARHPVNPHKVAWEVARDVVQAYPRQPVPTQQLIELQYALTRARKDQETFRDGFCPTCEQPVADGHRHGGFKVEDLEGQVEAMRQQEALLWAARYKEAQAALQEAEAKYRLELDRFTQFFTPKALEAEQVSQAAQQAVHDATKLAGDHQHLILGIQKAQALLADQPDVQVSEGALEAARAYVDTVQDHLARYQQATQLARGLEDQMGRADQELEQSRQGLERVSREVQAPDPQAVQQAIGDLERCRAYRQELQQVGQRQGVQQAKVAHLQVTQEEQRRQLSREALDAEWCAAVTAARDALHVSQYPAVVMREYAGVINQRIAHYLGVLDAPFRCWLDQETMGFLAEFSDGRRHAAARLSGAQRIIASVSFRLALTDTFASELGFVVLDEPSAYLDEANIENLQNLLLNLKQVSGESGRQIILITHEQALMGFADHVIELKGASNGKTQDPEAEDL